MGWRVRVKLVGKPTKRFRVWRIDVYGKPYACEGDYDTLQGAERTSVEIRLGLQNTGWEKIFGAPQNLMIGQKTTMIWCRAK